MSGRSTGSLTTELTAMMFSSVWLATCPSDSPVTSALAFSSQAMRSATRSMRRRYKMMRRLGGHSLAIIFW